VKKSPKIEIEAAFDRCVTRVGGVRISNLFNNTPQFSNADYLFEHDSVIAELKCLEKDPLSDPVFEDKISKLYNKWFEAGLVPPVPKGFTINTGDLPEQCAIELFGLFKKQLENSYIKKANKQIRESKAELNRHDAIGLLLLANDGNYALDPRVTFYLLHHTLKGQYTSIDHVIYFAANLRTDIPGVARNGFLWTSLKFDDRRQPSLDFERKLFQNWRTTLEEELGENLPAFWIPKYPPAEMDCVRFKR
jgi:hypothetical protein